MVDRIYSILDILLASSKITRKKKVNKISKRGVKHANTKSDKIQKGKKEREKNPFFDRTYL